MIKIWHSVPIFLGTLALVFLIVETSACHRPMRLATPDVDPTPEVAVPAAWKEVERILAHECPGEERCSENDYLLILNALDPQKIRWWIRYTMELEIRFRQCKEREKALLASP